MTENPYESPKFVPDDNRPWGEEAGTPEYYICDARRLTYRELYRILGGPLKFCMNAPLKMFRVPLAPVIGFASPAAYRTITPEELPESAAQCIRPLAEQLESLGFQFAVAYSAPMLGAGYSCCLSYLSSERHTISSVVYARVQNRASISEMVSNSCWSTLTDGQVLCTSGMKQLLDFPAELKVEHFPGSSVGELFERHLARLADCGKIAITPSAASQVSDTLSRIDSRAFEFQLSRGVYRLASKWELKQLLRLNQHYASGSLRQASWPTNEVLNTVIFLIAFLPSVLLFVLQEAQPQDFTQVMILGASWILVTLCAMAFIWRRRLIWHAV